MKAMFENYLFTFQAHIKNVLRMAKINIQGWYTH